MLIGKNSCSAHNQQACENCLQKSPAPDGCGQYRTYYLSPSDLTIEKEILARNNATNTAEIIELAIALLNSYAGILRHLPTNTEDEITWSALGKVMELGVDILFGAHELLENPNLVDSKLK